jgi:hypothetical protein
MPIMVGMVMRMMAVMAFKAHWKILPRFIRDSPLSVKPTSPISKGETLAAQTGIHGKTLLFLSYQKAGGPPRKYNLLTTLGPTGLNCFSHCAVAYLRGEAWIQQLTARNRESPASSHPQKILKKAISLKSQDI